MATQVTDYKCPACSAPLRFDAASGKLQCDYCESSYEVAQIEALYAAAETAAQTASNQATSWGEESEGMRVYSCPSCGAELICDASTAATSCPYCGNNAIVPGQFGGVLKPDYVIPFRLDKEQAVAALKKHYRGKRLLPKTFTDSNHIEELRGVYVPFWLCDGTADADMEYRATRSHSFRQGNEEITVTEHYRCLRAGSVEFLRIPVDASTKMPDEYMDSIEPFDYGELKPFSAAYMPGYLADKYDVSLEDCAARAAERARESTLDAMAATVTGYESCSPVREDINMRRGEARYAMLPVWMLHTKWKGKDFLFAMNGQTGKLVGDLPLDWGRFWALLGAVYAPLAAILAFILLR